MNHNSTAEITFANFRWQPKTTRVGMGVLKTMSKNLKKKFTRIEIASNFTSKG
jgi:hypothetical protein